MPLFTYTLKTSLHLKELKIVSNKISICNVSSVKSYK